MKNILFVGSQHGDERLGICLYEYIKYTDPQLAESATYLCANPLAFAQNVRFTESDMNRSYQSSDDPSYEHQRAQYILSYIDSHDFDYVLDFHTSTSDVDVLFISPKIDGVRREIIASSDIGNIVVMPEDIVRHSLIGTCPLAISVECNEIVAQGLEMLDRLTEFVGNLASGKTVSMKRNIYSISRLLYKEDLAEGEKVANYEKIQSGLYPVLYGEKSYKDYVCFAADVRETEVI